ncbi:aminotransferase class V-fold PLP-dependent enzyme [Terasakiella sp. A23]|uniref:aminotransferase class V-fold PLP-dependent enzyme n=1 Tax=Terasakiella sp. FCG-A23 TaxID=3080561 RepID=UPI0029536B9A|nr:aminotransferase class V-fold PLP-dependent enzyme [Terasakiella sp. A23]MDV7338538.1 aminotransferase class V-fold PLP-dependent enzyme [Terasakiella sp. A23]
MSLDVTRIRQEMQIKEGMIHFNNAGGSIMPTCVLDAQLSYLKLEAEIGGYEATDRYRSKIDATYHSIARLLNCSADEVAIVENATVAWSMAFYGIDFQAGDRILCGEAEYGSNYLAFLHLRDQKGISIDVIPQVETGELDLIALEGMIDDRVKLISLTHVPSNSGQVNPVKEVGKIARKNNILYLVDACQSAGQMPLDVEEIHCDMLSATSRKYLRGPRGMGFLYVRSSVIKKLLPPIIDLRSAELEGPDKYKLVPTAKRFENWENNYAALVGFKVAIDYALDLGLENIQARVQQLASDLRSKLSEIDQLTLHGHLDNMCGIVTFYIEGFEAEEVVSHMREQGINLSTSYRVSTPINAEAEQLPNLIRASVHYFNLEAETDRLVQALHQMIAAKG